MAKIEIGEAGPGLRRVVVFLIVLVVTAFAGCGMTKRIDAGHVGIRVKLAGNDRGVQDMELKTGWVVYNPMFEQIVLFPTSVQNIVWTASHNEGSPHDDSITFSSSEGVNVNGDIGLSFHIDPTLAPKLYGRFRQNDMMALANGYVRNVIREAFNEVASTMPVQEIYGSGKSKMLAEVQRRVAANLGKDGIVIDQLTINGALRLPENVAQAINRAMEATQNAIQSENRVRQVRAEADQAVTQATGAAEAMRQKAQGEADALLIRARSEAKANEIIRLSVSPTVLQYRSLERWNGQLPVYTAGGNGQLPMLTIDATKLGGGLDENARQKRLKELLEERGPGQTQGSLSQGQPAPAQPAAKPAEAPAQPQPAQPQPAPPPKGAPIAP
ncbi:MAG: prohibitin family protein [Myxococcales bacterium]|nr:prohibitin family protein [Myxococcales bacterium]